MQTRRPPMQCRAAASSRSRVTPPEPAGAGSFDNEAVARLHLCRCSRAQHLEGAVSALNPVTTCSSVTAPFDTARRDAPAIGKDIGAHRLKERESADHAVASAVRPRSSRAVTDRELIEANREPAFKNFGIG